MVAASRPSPASSLWLPLVSFLSGFERAGNVQTGPLKVLFYYLLRYTSEGKEHANCIPDSAAARCNS